MSNEVINPYQTFYDAAGAPLANGTIQFNVNLTTTKGTIYSDEALATTQANPYTLDAYGRIAGDVRYAGLRRLLIKNSTGATIRTIDNVSTVAGSGDVVKPLDFVADIQAANLTGTVLVQTKGYTTDNDGGQSLYYNDTSDSSTADDGFSVIVSNDSQRFKLLHDGIIHLAQTGIDATGASDANVAFNKPFRLLTNGGQIIGSPGAIYRIDPTVTVPATSTGGIDTDAVHFRYSNIKLSLNGCTIQSKTTNVDTYRMIYFGKLKDSQTAEALDTISNIVMEGPGNIIGDQDTHTASGSPTDEACATVYATNFTNGVIRDLSISKAEGDGMTIGLSPGANSFTAPQNMLVDHVNASTNGRNNITCLQYEGLRISNCTLNSATKWAPKAGLNVEPDFSYVSGAAGQNLWSRGLTIMNNDMIGNKGAGIEVVDTTGTGLIEDLYITGNRVRDNGEAATGLSGGIRVISVDGTRSVRIIGNEVSANFGMGIDIDGQSSSALQYRFIVANNEVKGTLEGLASGVNYGSGILFRDGTNGFLCIGNYVERNDYHGIFCGTDGAGGCAEGIISNNFIYGNSRKTDNTYDGIHVEAGCFDIEVSGNYVKKALGGDAITNEQQYGINYLATTGRVIGNNITASGQTGNLNVPNAIQMPDHGLLVDVKDNLGYVNETTFRSSVFSASTGGASVIIAAHGLDTYGLGTAADNERIKSQFQITPVYSGTTGSAFIQGAVLDVDATNVHINTNVTTAAAGNMRWAVSVKPPSVDL